MSYLKKEIEIGGRILSFEIGKYAKQADGAVMVRYADTMVLATAVASEEQKKDIDFMPLSVEYREIVETFSSSGHSRLPVYDGTIDNIIGIIDVKDLFKNPKNINEILKEPYFVPEKKRCIELLRDFKEKNISMAIVVDEFGGVSGLITLEDVIEELVGEIEDEFDTGKNLIQKVDSNTFILNGLVEIDRLNEEYNLNIPKGDYETISGFVINNIGRIPSKGEEFIINDFKITILNATRTRINSLKLTLLKHHE